jgi:hypothetical protein
LTAQRQTLPQRRQSETITVPFAGERYHVTTGFFDDGRTGEIFINRIRDKAAAKLGGQLDGVCRDSAILLSLALQHGVSLDTIRHAVTRDDDGAPSTIVGAIIEMIGGTA